MGRLSLTPPIEYIVVPENLAGRLAEQDAELPRCAICHERGGNVWIHDGLKKQVYACPPCANKRKAARA